MPYVSPWSTGNDDRKGYVSPWSSGTGTGGLTSTPDFAFNSPGSSSGTSQDSTSDDRNVVEKSLNLKPKQNWFFDALEVVDRLRNSLATGVKHSIPYMIEHFSRNPTLNPLKGIKDAIDHPKEAFADPASGLVKGITGQEHTSTQDFLSDEYKQEHPYLSAAAGFVGDVATDPTTYAGGSGIAKAAAPFISKAASKLPGPVLNAAEKTKDFLGHIFQPGYGMPEEYKALRTDYLNKVNAGTQGAIDTAVKLAKPGGKLMSEADRRLVAEGVENPRVLGAPGYQRAPQEVVDASRLTRKLLQSGAREEQAAGLLSSTRKNYFPHVATDEVKGLKTGTVGVQSNPFLRANDKFSKGRQLEGTISEINANHMMNGGKGPMFEEDFAKAFGTREVSRKRAIATQQFVDDALSKFGQKVPAGTKTAPEGYTIVKPDGQWKFYRVDNHMAVSKNAPTYIMPEKVASDLESFHKPFIENDSLRTGAQAYDKVLGLWKGLMTSPNPGFHIRNTAGNLFNNALGGVVNPERYMDAAKVARGGKDVLDVGGTPYTLDEIKNLATRQGILGTGQFGTDIPGRVGEELERGLKTPWQKAADVVRHPIQSGRVVGNTIEDNAKLAHFIDRLSKGDAPEQAAESTKKFLFDYGDLTATEREVFKRMMPFYTWSRKNIPLQLEMMMKKPGMYTGPAHAVDNMTQALGVDDSNLPDYMKNQMALPMTRDANGNAKYLTMGLPLQDLNRIHLNPLDDAKEAGQMLSPLFSIPGQLLSNKQWYNGAPVEKYPGEMKPAPFPLNMVLPHNGNDKQTGQAGAYIPAPWAFGFNQLGAVRNYAQAGNDAMSGKVPFLSSFVKDYDPGKEAYFQALQDKQQRQNEKRKARDLMPPAYRN